MPINYYKIRKNRIKMKTELKQKIFDLVVSTHSHYHTEDDPILPIEAVNKIKELINEELQKEAIAFAEWVRDKHYVRYWGSQTNDMDKWYDYPTACKQPIVRPLKLFTSEELYKQFKTEQGK